VPQVGPGGRGLVHHGGVVDDAGGAEHIGDAVGVLRVVVGVAVALVDQGKVGDVVEVQGQQHPLVDHLGHHIVGGDDDVVAGRARFELGIHRLVGVEGGVVDADGGEPLKGVHHVDAAVRAVGDVFAPVVDVQGHVLAGKTGPVVISRHADALHHLDGLGGPGGHGAGGRHRQGGQKCK